jgi:hypothetical protein
MWPQQPGVATPQGGLMIQPQGSTGVPQMPQQPQVQQPGVQQGYSFDPANLPQPQQQVQTPQQGQSQQPSWAPQQPQQQFAQQPQQGQPWGGQPQMPQAPQAQRFVPQGQMILDGPDVPPELRGRTWGEAMRLHTALATDWRQRNAAPTPAQQTLQSQGQFPQQAPQGQPQAQRPQAQAQANPAAFFQDPERRVAEIVGQVIDQRVMPALQPMVQQSQASAVHEARRIAAQGMPDFQQLEGELVQALSQLPASELTNPGVWVAAANMIRGQQVASGQYRAPQQNGQVPQPQWNGNGAFGGRYEPAQQQIPQGQFFSEAPTAPPVQGYAQNGAGRMPTQEEQFYAQKWGMPIGEFMAYKYGVAQQGGAR